MREWIAYGYVNTNRKGEFFNVENSLAYKQLLTIPGVESGLVDIVIDTGWNTERRPKLEELISKLGDGDIIYMYSIDTLLSGRNKGVEYYSQIINKGIHLSVFDHSGNFLKISPISTVSMPDVTPYTQLSELKKEELIKKMEQLSKEYVYLPKTGKTTYKANLTNEFKNLYFQYEAYRITEKELMEILKKDFNIYNKQTFISMCRMYEKSLTYQDDCKDYQNADNKFISLPKRTGKIPSEYFEIMELANTLSDKEENDRINHAIGELGIYCNHIIINRLTLAKNKAPKPRKPDGRHVDFTTKDYI